MASEADVSLGHAAVPTPHVSVAPPRPRPVPAPPRPDGEAGEQKDTQQDIWDIVCPSVCLSLTFPMEWKGESEPPTCPPLSPPPLASATYTPSPGIRHHVKASRIARWEKKNKHTHIYLFPLSVSERGETGKKRRMF